jgi:amidase
MKANLSEFASGAAMSSLGGQSHNPHNLEYTPGGSSGGTGVSIAAAYAPLGYGTDTGGSIRSPSTSNGIVGLKPTQGLLSRAGIIPLVLSFDTGGPMARSVYDIAVSLNVTTGLDPRDDATKRAEGKIQADYTKFLDKGALKGARIGVARDFFGQDAEVDTTMESALQAMRNQGATVIDVHYPDGVLKARNDISQAISRSEFKAQVAVYLATLKPGYPKTLSEMIALSEKVTSPALDGSYQQNPVRLAGYRMSDKGPPLTDPLYLAAKDFGVPYIRESLIAVFKENNLDVIVYPTSPRRPSKISDFTPPPSPGSPPAGNSPTSLANITGFPDLIVPAGFTTTGLPIGISFFGQAWSEPKILAIGYAYEQATHALRQPVNTPSLPGESFTY